ncbi:acetyl-CoA C-acyltransferase [Candidatus Sumerlaeota bacterium]|nr:acetyl-CoA C-acyltransferase [Candidatus Sumerlaeota bacterium]
MREAVVVASARTALAKSGRGSFNMTRPDDLAGHAVRAALAKVPQLAPEEIEDVIMGCGTPERTQGMNVARIAATLAGLPVSVSGTTVNRFCSSGLQSIAMAAHEIIHEGAEAAIGAGVESITFMEGQKFDPNPEILKGKPTLYYPMGMTAEVVAKRYKVSRQAQDEYALSSQQRTAAAQKRGFYADEIAPITVKRKVKDKATGEEKVEENITVVKDECNRADTTLEGLAGLKPVFDPSPAGTVTAGNSSQFSDGASATVLMSRERAEKLGIKPKLIFRGFAVAGCEPDEMGIGPVFAVPKLLKRHGLKVEDIDLWELNEAFAVQVVYCRDRLGIPQEKLNVNGGSISIGHPYGMTGSRMVGTLANEMLARKAKYGIVTMCVGGGMGAAGLFEACL